MQYASVKMNTMISRADKGELINARNPEKLPSAVIVNSETVSDTEKIILRILDSRSYIRCYTSYSPEPFAFMTVTIFERRRTISGFSVGTNKMFDLSTISCVKN